MPSQALFILNDISTDINSKIFERPRDKNQQNDCAPSENSDQPEHVWSESSLCAQWIAKDLSSLPAQADLIFRWAHMPLCWFCHEAVHLLCLLKWHKETGRTHCNFRGIQINGMLVKAMVYDMSRDMTKPTKWLCTQRRLRSAWAFAHFDRSLRCALNG